LRAVFTNSGKREELLLVCKVIISASIMLKQGRRVLASQGLLQVMKIQSLAGRKGMYTRGA
jgi:hypothetical protein